MATSGSFNGSPGYQGRTLQFAWSRQGYSIADCYSDIYWELRVVGGSSSYYYHYHEHCYINGAEKYGNDSRTKRYTGTIASGTQRIYHNTSTGAGSFTARVYGAMYTSSYNVDTTQTFNLDTIPRQANITECPSSLTDEGTPYLKFSNPGNFNMQCWLEVNPNSDHLAQRTIPTAKSGTYTWELTSSERTQLRQALGDSKSGKIRIGLYSNSGQWASYKDIPFSIVNDAPTLGTCSYSATNHTDLAYTSTIIKGYSNVNVTVGQATAKKDATIKSYKVVIGSQVKTNTTYGTFSFSNVDSDTIEIYVEDNRGNVATTVLKASTFIEYVEPYLEKPTFHRGDGGIGTDVELTIKGTMWTGGFGKLSNALISVVYYYKEQGASTWIQGATAISITTASSFEKTIAIRGDLGANGFDAGKNYDIKVVILDRLSQKEATGLLLSGKPLIAYHPNGISFGGFYDESEGGLIQYEGKKIVIPYDCIIEQGLKNDWYYRKYSSGIMECWRNSGATLGSSSAWGSVYTQSIQLVNNFPFEFTEVPTINVSLIDCSSGYNGWIVTNIERGKPTTAHPGAYQYCRATSGTSGTATVSYRAIGNWK